MSDKEEDNLPNSNEIKKDDGEKEEKNDDIKFSQVLQKESNKEKEIEKNDLFSTRVFMKSIDLRCEDHLSKFQEDMEATRFCQKCNILCCDSCVIDYHVEHI